MTRQADVTLAEAILIAHQRHDYRGCLCGWSELGKSHPGHRVAMLRDAGLHLTSETAAELRREGARRVGVQLESAYDRHVHSQPIDTRGKADGGKAEGLREAIHIARRTSARPTSEES